MDQKNEGKVIVGSIDVQADGYLVKLPYGPAPTVREMVDALSVFSQAICATEAYARAGQGGFVRIEAMAPVMAAIKQYMDLLPAASIER